MGWGRLQSHPGGLGTQGPTSLSCSHPSPGQKSNCHPSLLPKEKDNFRSEWGGDSCKASHYTPPPNKLQLDSHLRNC